ncbi:MAG: PQQ-binding-like beta-propeller repeat protein, partial [Planctomycetota bacterium]
YFGTITGTTGYLYAINADGSLKWSFNAGSPINSSPAIGPDGAIYFSTTGGQVYARNSDNSAKWGPVNVGGNINFSSPVIHPNGNTLYICRDAGGLGGRIYALATNNGSSLWGAPYATPQLIRATPALGQGGGVLYVGDIGGNLYAVDTSNGTNWWSSNPIFPTGFYSSPLVDVNNYIYLGATNNLVYAMKDNGQGTFPGTAWTIPLGGPITYSSCALAGNGALYIGAGDGKLYKLASGFAAIDPANIQISKKANKQQVAIGDAVTYKITITNSGIDPTDPGQTTTIIDKIPPGFKYIKESSRLTIGNNTSSWPNPTGETVLTFDVGDFAVGETKILTYQLVVGSGVTFGKHENKAYARYFYNKPPLTEETSPIVKETVLVVPDPLFDSGTIIGKVFNDRNGNGTQDNDEEGIEGAQIITEEGAIVTTDKDGKYHIPGVAPGTHLLKLRSPAVQETSSFQIVRVTEGLLCKVNFGIVGPNPPADVVGTNSIHVPGTPKAFGVPTNNQTDFTLVALGESELGYSRVSEDRQADLTQHAKNDGRFKDGWYDKSKFAGYLKANIQDKYRITSSLDTQRTRNRELFRYIDPDKYYPLYGDDSSIDWDATNTQGPLYLFVETTPKSGLGNSSFLWGNYATNLDGNQLATYNRTLYGAKLSYRSLVTDHRSPDNGNQLSVIGNRSEATLFAAEAYQIAAHNEFRATGGSFYYLKHKHIMEGSEQIRIETRDKITNLSLSTSPKSRDTDYEIDYSNGRIIFKQPVGSISASHSIISSNILDGNPVYIIVDYEYRPDRFHFNQGTYGGRTSYAPFNHTTLGATYVQEQVDAEDYQLTGLDTTINLPLATKLKVDYAETVSRGISGFVSLNGGFTFNEISLTPTAEGSAYRISTESKPITTVGFNTYYQRLQAGFSTAGSVTQQGTEKYGLFISHQIIPDKLTLNLRYDAQEVLRPVWDGTSLSLRNPNTVSLALVGGQKTEATTLQGVYQKDRLTLTGEYRYQKVVDDFSNLTSETNRDTALGALKAAYKLTEKVNVFLEQQGTLKGESNYQTTAGLAAQLQKNLAGTLQGTTGTKGNSALLGLTSQVSEQTQAYTNISYATQRSAEATVESRFRRGDDSTTSSSPGTLSSSTGRPDRTTSVASGVSSQITPATRIYVQEEYRTSSSAVSTASAVGQDTQVSKQWQVGFSFERGLINNFDGTDTIRKSGSLR